MNTKENWLIAWSIFRLIYKDIPEQTEYPGENKNIKYLLPIAEKCFNERNFVSNLESSELKDDLEIHLKDKGFQKEWTGWKYTWVKFEEKDVPF